MSLHAHLKVLVWLLSEEPNSHCYPILVLSFFPPLRIIIWKPGHNLHSKNSTLSIHLAIVEQETL